MEQLGDIFTKGLPRAIFKYLRKKMMGWWLYRIACIFERKCYYLSDMTDTSLGIYVPKGPRRYRLLTTLFLCVSLFYVSYDWAREVSEDTFDRDEWEFIARYLLLHLIHLNSYSHPHHVFILLILHRLSIPSIDSSFIIIVIRIARGVWCPVLQRLYVGIVLIPRQSKN